VDFGHLAEFWITRKQTFPQPGVFPSSAEEEETPTVLGPLGRANLNRLGVSYPTPEDGKRSGCRKVAFNGFNTVVVFFLLLKTERDPVAETLRLMDSTQQLSASPLLKTERDPVAETLRLMDSTQCSCLLPPLEDGKRSGCRNVAFNGFNTVVVCFPLLKTERDPVAESLRFLVIYNLRRWAKSTRPLILMRSQYC
jgi:hypothetical protein